MQWHPMFAHLLRPLLQAHYEVRTGQPVGDMPRHSDIVLLRKTSSGPLPYRGLWRRLTTWNVLEYKGPTVSPRQDELHDLIELGLGIHRRLNELEAKKEQPVLVDYPEVSFWYLVNHIGRRFLQEVPTYLPGIQQEAGGIWRAVVFSHPVFLVSVQELEVEHDSLPLHVLSGVPDEQKGTVTEVLRAEPALWPNYGGWLASREKAIWEEIRLMAAQQEQEIVFDVGPLADYLVETDGLKRFIEAVGIKQAVRAVGARRVLEAVGPAQFLADVSPEQRDELRRLLNQQLPSDQTKDPT
jgi:hypothetical protein